MPRPVRSLLALVVAVGVSFALGTTSAGAAWSPVGGVSAINNAHDRDAYDPSMTVIDGVPYVARSEWDATGAHLVVHVSRLNASGTGWEEVGDGIGAGLGSAAPHSIVAVDGVPYVAWSARTDRNTDEIRVSRLNAAGTEWEEVGGTSPINQIAHAYDPNLTVVDGVLHVAWNEADGFATWLRVRRLNASGTTWEPVGGGTAASGSEDFLDRVGDASIAAVDGLPYVAFTQSDGTNSELRVRRPNPAGTAWEEVVDGPNPVNHSADAGAGEVSLTTVRGVPHLAWTEWNGDVYTVRVSRLNAAGTDWVEIGGGTNPINHAPDKNAANPSLAEVGGRPYVAWLEDEEVRVSRTDAGDDAWEEVVGGTSPISREAPAYYPSLAAVGVVPYVAWIEWDGANFEVQVSRLEPEFLSQAALTTDTEALVLSRVRTYGVAYPIAFEYGPNAGLGARTRATPTSHGLDTDTAFRVIRRLTPETSYLWRPIGFDGWRITGTGPTGTFTTRQAFEPAPPGLLVALIRENLRALAGRGVTVRYLATRPANVRLVVRRGGKPVASVRGRARAGRNGIRWDGRIAGRRPRPGRYALVLRAADADGQHASDRASLRIARRQVGPK